MSKKTKKDILAPDPMSDIFTASMWSKPKNQPLLLSFINGVLSDFDQKPIITATVQNPFNIKNFAVDKSIILDVRVKDEHDWLYDIEVQTGWHVAFPNRVLHYWADMYASQMTRGDLSKKLRPAISIILTSFPIFPQLKNVHNVFQLASRENPDVLMTDHLQVHFLRVAEVMKQGLHLLEDIRRDLRDWLNFFAFAGEKNEREMAALTQNNPIIQEAYAELQRFYADGENREKIKERERFLMDYNLGITSSYEEGEAKGKAEIIIRILSKRFKAVPEGLQSRLMVLADVDQFDRLADVALDCNTLEEFMSHLR